MTSCSPNITLRLVDPVLGLVSMGEQCRPLTVGVLNRPIMAYFTIYTWRYFKMHAGCCMAERWFVTTVLGSNSGHKKISHILEFFCKLVIPVPGSVGISYWLLTQLGMPSRPSHRICWRGNCVCQFFKTLLNRDFLCWSHE